MDDNGSRAGWFGVKAVAAVVVGALGMGAIFYSSSVGTETSKKSPLPPADSQTIKAGPRHEYSPGPDGVFSA